MTPTIHYRLPERRPRQRRSLRLELLALYLLALCASALVADFITLDQLLHLLRTASALFLLNTATVLLYQIGMALVAYLRARALHGPAPRPTFIVVAARS